mmetsp:Transcript_10291/g.23830  ORF Transcript_10291/g.23830 Transcript_10291/m.23830 type:complete len:202 (-) Transcript_10291:248-853(-)
MQHRLQAAFHDVQRAQHTLKPQCDNTGFTVVDTIADKQFGALCILEPLQAARILDNLTFPPSTGRFETKLVARARHGEVARVQSVKEVCVVVAVPRHRRAAPQLVRVRRAVNVCEPQIFARVWHVHKSAGSAVEHAAHSGRLTECGRSMRPRRGLRFSDVDFEDEEGRQPYDGEQRRRIRGRLHCRRHESNVSAATHLHCF